MARPDSPTPAPVKRGDQLRVLFLAEGTQRSASAVHRCDMVSEGLSRHGISSEVRYGWALDLGEMSASTPSPRSMWDAFRATKAFDVLIVNRSASLPVLVLVKFWIGSGKTVVYDFDDAVYLIKNLSYSRFSEVASTSSLVFAGSHELLRRVTITGRRSFLMPTPVDTDLFDANRFSELPGRSPCGKTTIGWLGIARTATEDLKLLVPVLKRLSSLYPNKVRFSLLSGLGSERVMELFSGIHDLEIDFGPDTWTEFLEIPRHLSRFDISVMPLRDTLWNRGKCATKLLESMSMGIPVVASPVGENKYVVNDGVNGHLAGSVDEWVGCLSKLIEDESLRKVLGKRGRERTVESYSVESIARLYLAALRS